MPGGRIELVGVTKEFKIAETRKIAVNNISLTIEQGEFIGVVGMNGSGKSTLARLMNGLIQPTAGKVLVNDRNTGDRRRLNEIRSYVGMVFQNPDNQIISSIVEEDIAFGPENLRLSPAEVKERVDWALEAMGLASLRRHAPHLLSGGQKQKVAIASVLAMRPDHLILDEPTSMLDPLGRQELLMHLRMLNERYGLTIVLISHYIEDVAQVDRLLVLDQGSLRLDGVPGELFKETAELVRLGFELPDVVRLANNLRKQGLIFGRNINTVQELVETICQLSM